MPKKSIADIDPAGRTTLMRVDFNVPLKAGAITDDRRIRQALDSIRSVTDRGGRLVLASHLGRPGGNGPEPDFSLAPCAERLGEHLGQTVRFAPDCLGAPARQAVAALEEGQVLLLENLRFHAGEVKNDPAFARELAAHADIYCNDAFGTAHRAHASTLGVPQALEPGKPRVIGLLMQREIAFLKEAIESPEHPFVAVLGGAKVSDKIGAIRNLLNRVDRILLGGAMAYTFLLAEKKSAGRSLVEEAHVKEARAVLDAANRARADLFLPLDHVCGKELSRQSPTRICREQIEAGWMGLDIGPETINRYTGLLADARTIVWNGPMGCFETPPFDVGTREIAGAIAEATRTRGATSIIGGGDSAAAVEALGLADAVSHVSTGGGASLEMLKGADFPGLALLDDA